MELHGKIEFRSLTIRKADGINARGTLGILKVLGEADSVPAESSIEELRQELERVGNGEGEGEKKRNTAILKIKRDLPAMMITASLGALQVAFTASPKTGIELRFTATHRTLYSTLDVIVPLARLSHLAQMLGQEVELRTQEIQGDLFDDESDSDEDGPDAEDFGPDPGDPYDPKFAVVDGGAA